MFCSNCGTQIDGKFCAKCGNESSGQSVNAQSAKKSKPRNLILASVIGGVLLLAVLAGLFLTGSFGGKDAEAAADPNEAIRNSLEYSVVNEFFDGMLAYGGSRDALCISSGAFRSVASTYFTGEGFSYEELKLLQPAIALVYEDRC